MLYNIYIYFNFFKSIFINFIKKKSNLLIIKGYKYIIKYIKDNNYFFAFKNVKGALFNKVSLNKLLLYILKE